MMKHFTSSLLALTLLGSVAYGASPKASRINGNYDKGATDSCPLALRVLLNTSGTALTLGVVQDGENEENTWNLTEESTNEEGTRTYYVTSATTITRIMETHSDWDGVPIISQDNMVLEFPRSTKSVKLIRVMRGKLPREKRWSIFMQSSCTLSR